MKLIYDNSKNSDLFYATKVQIPDAYFFFDLGNKKYVFLDHREFDVFKEKNTDCSIELVLLDPIMAEAKQLTQGNTLAQKIALYLLKKYNLMDQEIFVQASFPLEMGDFLRAQGVTLTIAKPFYPQRLIKSVDEKECITNAIKKTQKAYQYIEEVLTHSVIKDNTILFEGKILTSEMLKNEVEKILLEQNLLNTEGIIISCGPHAAIPHHPGEGPIFPYQTIICDLFPKDRSTGYFADMTRTYVKGEPSQKLVQLYDAVKKTQEAALQAVKAGVTGGSVHQTCIDLFLEMGYHVGDKGFVHGTGHGLGLDIHEEPNLKPDLQTILEPGHVVTVEPGLYYPELGGVRIEDVVYVTEYGCENLTQYPKEFVIL